MSGVPTDRSTTCHGVVLLAVRGSLVEEGAVMLLATDEGVVAVCVRQAYKS
jgi:hypothetical protein